MAVPTDPTVDAIVTEALKRAEIDIPTTAHITRARDIWIEEIKAEIQLAQTVHNLLETEKVIVILRGKRKYPLSSYIPDFEYLVNIEILDASDGDRGVIVASGSNTFTLKADDSGTADSREGREIVILSEAPPVSSITLTGEVGVIKSYNPSTKVATLFDNVVTTATGYDYLIVGNDNNLDSDPLDTKNDMSLNGIGLTIPDRIYEYNRELRLVEIPDKKYAMRVLYGVNITRLDTTSALLTKLFREWRPLWTQGIIAKELQRADSDRADNELTKYYSMLASLSAKSSSVHEIRYNDM